MRKPVLKLTLASLAVAGIFTSCGPALNLKSVKPLAQDISNMPEKQGELSQSQLKDWPEMGIYTDTVPGMSVEKAYREIIKNNKGKQVIVAVLDAGVDIDHEDLKDVIWTNPKEKPGNGIDDDKNGYIDDIHGWNFLGDAVHENLEMTRILKVLKPKYDGKTADQISADNKAEFELYQHALEEYNLKLADAERGKARFEQLKSHIDKAISILKEHTESDVLDLETIKAINANTDEVKGVKSMMVVMLERSGADNAQSIADQINDAYNYFSNQLKYHLNLDFNGRAIVGDDVNDITDTNYGNNDVDGPTADEEDVMHGTHVAGIIAAVRNNGIGMNGVAKNVKIMAIRAVPDGDEYDKDIALGIRYAVDNGAKVINMSFGKYYSTHPDWVVDAIKYAAKHDVLLVKAAGNEGINLDEKRAYPNDQWPGQETEIADNVITIGALNPEYGELLVAPFSNYGKTNVDVFSPGVKIYSTTPLNHYEFLQGTSMAAPEVAGIAAVIRSYFPKLSAAQVKEVIMKSGLTTTKEVVLGGDANDTKPFNQVSVSGKMANLYNALILASKM